MFVVVDIHDHVEQIEVDQLVLLDYLKSMQPVIDHHNAKTCALFNRSQ